MLSTQENTVEMNILVPRSSILTVVLCILSYFVLQRIHSLYSVQYRGYSAQC